MIKKLLTATGIALLVVGFVVVSPIDAQAQTTTNTLITRDLTIGSTGPDVAALQSFLVSRGFMTMPPGVPMGYFGSLTRSALARYQASVGITPAAGYFGPVTRAHYNAQGTVVITPQVPGCQPGAVFSTITGQPCNPTSVPGCPVGAVFNYMTGARCDGTTQPQQPQQPTNDLRGDEGNISNFEILGNPSNEDAREGDEDVEILGFEFEAEDSDLRVERLDVLFQAEDGSSEDPWDYIDTISLWRDNRMIAEEDASSERDWSESRENLGSGEQTYRFRFTGLNNIVREGDTAEFIIAVTPHTNMDGDDTPQEFEVAIDDNGLRAIDARGIYHYEGDADDTVTITFDEAEAGDLDLSRSNDGNDDRVVEVSRNSVTRNVEIFRFNIESETSDNVIEELVVMLATTSDSTTALSQVIRNLTLFADGDQIGGTERPAGLANGSARVVFDDLDFEIGEDEEVEFIVRAEIAEQNGRYNEGYRFQASVNGADIEAEDSQGDNIDIDGTVTGGEIELRTAGQNVNLLGTTATRIVTADDPGESDRAQYTIRFRVTAFGDDIYIDKSTQQASSGFVAGGGVGWDISEESTGTTTTSTAILSASGNAQDVSGNPNVWRIRRGSSADFTLTVVLEAGSDGATGIRLTAINWDTDAADTTPDEFYTFNLEDFETDLLPLNVNP